MVDDRGMGELRTIAKEGRGFMRGLNFGCKAVWDWNSDAYG
jgi:hypothetical protein